MDVSTLQIALSNAGYDPGGVDGALGARTYAALMGYTVRRPISAMFSALAKTMAQVFPASKIDAPPRIAHWLGQAAYESADFEHLTELGNAADFARYDGRADLGNLHPGDGARFRGRGLFQITGRANYARCSQTLGLDLIDHPERAAEPDVAVRTACLFWSDHHLNALADADDSRAITQRINGGQNGYADRLAYTIRVKAIFA